MNGDYSILNPSTGFLRMGHGWISQPSSASPLLHLLLHLLLLLSLLLSPAYANAAPAPDHDYGAHPRFVCTPIPADADPTCFPTGGPATGAGGPGPHVLPGGGGPSGLWGMTEEAKTTILHLRESLVQQKETILEQRETIRELTAKLSMCEGFGRGAGGGAHDGHHGSPSHHSSPSSHHGGGPGGHHRNADSGHRSGDNAVPDGSHHSERGPGHGQGKDKHVTPGAMTSPEQMSRMLQTLKERLENLQSRNTSTAYSGSLKELLQRKINALEQQMHHHPAAAALSSLEHHDDDGGHHDNGTHRRDDHHDEGNLNDHDDRHGDEDEGDGHYGSSHREDYGHHGDHDNNETDSHGFLPRTGVRNGQGSRAGPRSDKLEPSLNHHQRRPGSRRKKTKSPDAFQISFPMRTNYMYGRVKRTLLHEIFAFTLCLWIKGDSGPGLGTPFSYSVPGQANELVLIEWGNNPMELLVDDKAVTLPLSLGDGKWHHVCVTWSTRDGQWEAYQDGVKRGSGENLSAWHPIKPGGVFILGQEQDTLGGRFDATQSFVGEISDLQMWSNVLSANDISGLASCGSHLSGDVFAWSETVVELHGGVTMYPFDPCH